MQLLLISGSLRRDSHNSALLRAAAAMLPPGWEAEIYAGLGELPPYDEDADGEHPPAAVGELREAIARADGILIATPEYNASIPGVLKNAIDWASRPFDQNPARGKPAAVIGASTGIFGAVWAQAETRKVLAHIGARVLEAELPVGTADEAFEADGTLSDPDLNERLREIVAELAGAAVPQAVAA
jgi:chromate reductase